VKVASVFLDPVEVDPVIRDAVEYGLDLHPEHESPQLMNATASRRMLFVSL
jgi:hypothetical protein